MSDIALLAALAILEAVQALGIIAHIYSFIPVRWTAAIPKGLEPERESFLYTLFLGIAVAFMVAAMVWLRPRLANADLRRKLIRFMAMESVWVFLMLFCFFKWLTYRYPFYNVIPFENGQWVMPFFYVVVALSVLGKIFWPEIDRFYVKAIARMPAPALTRPQRFVLAGGMMALIACLLWPNAADVVALNYAWDQFRHWDEFILTRHLMLAGVSPEGIVMWMFAATVVLWTGIFILAAHWLRDYWLTAAAVLLGIKVNLFHYGMAPAPWLFPQATLLNIFPVDSLAWQGLGSAPMFDALRVRQFFSFFMGFCLPVFYVATLLLLWGKADQKRVKVAQVLAIYGLLTYTFYICRPTLFAYGTVAVPAVMLLFFWAAVLIDKAKHRQPIVIGIALIAFFALLTSRVFVNYPHVWGGPDFDDAREAARNSDLSADAALVAKLVPAGQPAAVLGSFELELLRQAQRAPLWRQAPVFMSTPLEGTAIRGLRLSLRPDVLSLMAQIDQQAPEYIFVERKLLALPASFYETPTGLSSVLATVGAKYKVTDQGRHYIAMKRNQP